MKKKFAKVVASLAMATAMVTTSAFGTLNVFAGSVVGQSTFDDGVGLPWHTCQTNPANQSFEIKDGAYVVTINNPGGRDRGGDSRWDLQLRHRGIKIQSGHKYKVSFKINASNAGELTSKIGDYSGDTSGEVWHNTMDTEKGVGFNQSWSNLQIAKGDNEFEFTFTSDKTLEVAEWAFHYGGAGQYQDKDCFPEGTVLTFDDLELECLTCDDTSGNGCNWDSTNEMGKVTPRSDVRINQVGYYTNLSKVASYATDEEIAPVSFALKDASGKTVYEGTGVSKGYDEASGEWVQLLDFTEFNTAGKDYYIEVSDTENVQTNQYTKEAYNMYKSQTFDIVNPANGDVYEGVLANALNYYYQNRSGVEIESSYITSGDKEKLAHQAGHQTDMAYVQSEWVKSYAGDGSDVNKSYSIDCTGGWYDAGDHGKYVVNGGISVWTLQNMYEMSQLSGTDSKWSDSQTMSIPQSYKAGDISYDGTGDPDILDEARVELEWMFKMIVQSNDPYYGKDKAGMVYHKMHDHKWTGLAVHAWDYADTWGTIRIVKPPTTAATLNVAATAAQAARLWKGLDDEFAAECLENAKLTYEAAKKNPDVFAPLDQAIGGGAYGDDYVGDDFYWAACELYAATGDQQYYDDLTAYVNSNDKTGNDKAFSLTTSLGGGENSGSFSSFNWGCTAGLGTLTLYLNQDGLTDSEKATVEDAIVSAADEYIAQENEEGMGIPYRGTTFTDSVNIGEGVEVNGYEWGSNSFVVNNAMVMAYAYKIKGTNKYMSGVSTALDYIFGRNGLGISYVTGTGDYYTQNPHHRYWSYELDKSFPKAPSGVMSGGAGSGLQDPYVGGLGYVRGKVAPQKCYVDSAEAWSVNEVTINWNAPFAWVLSFMQDEAKTAPNAEGNVTVPDVTTEKPATEEQVTTEDGSDVTTEATVEVTTEADNKTEATTEDVDADATTQKVPVKVTTEDDNKTEATTEDVDADATTQKVPVKVTTEDDNKTEATTEDVDADATTQKVPVKVTTEDDNKTDVTTEDRNADATTAGVPEAPTTEDTDADVTTEDRNADATTAGVPEAPTTEDTDADVTTEDRDADATTAGVPEAPTTEDTDVDVTTEDRDADATTAGVPESSLTTEDTDTDVVSVESVTLKPSSITLEVGSAPIKLSATVLPENATNKELTWTTSKPTSNIISLTQDGEISALEEGQIWVFAKANNGKVGKCKVTVVETTEDEGNVTTENNDSDKATTEDTKPGKTTTEDNDSDKATTEDTKPGKTTTEDSDSDKATTEDTKPGKTTTEDNDSDKATTEDTKPGKTTTEDNDSDKATTEDTKPGKTTTEDNDSDKTTTEDSDADKVTTENNNSGSDTTDNNNTGNDANQNNSSTTTAQTPATTTQTPAGPSANPLEPSVLVVGTNTFITNSTIYAGSIIKGNDLKYQITKCDATGKEASVYGLAVNKLSNVKVPNMIVINNEVYKVTSVKSKAFYNKSSIKKVTLGKNIKTIGSKAFYKCKNVKTLTIKTTKLTTKSVKSNAFAKMKAKLTVKVPKAKKAAYKKLLVKRGVSKKATIK